MEDNGGPKIECPSFGGAPIHIRRNMLTGIIPFDDHDENLWKISDESTDEELSGTILFLHCVDSKLRDNMIIFGWFQVKLHIWKDVFKDFMDISRRTGMFGDVCDDRVYQLRKIFKVTYRRQEEADWDTEKYERQGLPVSKCMACGKSWIETAHAKMKIICDDMINRMGKTRVTETIDSWWMSRHHNTPGGSSSLRTVCSNKLKADPRLARSDRPNKKAVFECLDDKCIWRWICSMPVNIARSSTKPESGGKQRALFASDDPSYAIGAYSSVHMEKELNYRGMCGKQKPMDVIKWFLIYVLYKGWWLSADYHNFNIEHECWLLRDLNVMLAMSWLQYGNEKIRLDKVITSLWVAQSFDISFVRTKEESYRVFNGLYSGHRNTARDNTMLHRVYSDVALDDCVELGFNIVPKFEAICGDDEDCCFNKWYESAIYLSVLQLEGHTLKTTKQLAGDDHHEFLQLLCLKNEMPERPLASILSTIATGNWYVQPGLWYESATGSVGSNFWDCHCRGMPLKLTRKLCCRYLDLYMRVKDENNEWKNLEWWEYRDMGGGKFLWDGCHGKKSPLLKLQTVVSRNNKWPTLASDDWLKKMSGIIRHMKDDEVARYKKFLVEASYSGSFHTERMEKMKELTLKFWPERKEVKYDIIGSGMITPVAINKWMILMSTESRKLGAPSAEEVYARIGLDPQIVNIIGEENIPKLKIGPELWMRYTSIIEPSEINVNYALSNVAFRALASYHSSTMLNLVKRKEITKYLVICCSSQSSERMSVLSRHMIDGREIYTKNGWDLIKEKKNKNDVFNNVENKILALCRKLFISEYNILILDGQLDIILGIVLLNKIRVEVMIVIEDSNDDIITRLKISSVFNKLTTSTNILIDNSNNIVKLLISRGC